jgi:hypothetical protein
MHAVMNDVFEVEEMPKDWEEGIIFPVLNKGDILNCADYR